LLMEANIISIAQGFVARLRPSVIFDVTAVSCCDINKEQPSCILHQLLQS
jgi:hypothetical protein